MMNGGKNLTKWLQHNTYHDLAYHAVYEVPGVCAATVVAGWGRLFALGYVQVQIPVVHGERDGDVGGIRGKLRAIEEHIGDEILKFIYVILL
jgi:hypothetical protein